MFPLRRVAVPALLVLALAIPAMAQTPTSFGARTLPYSPSPADPEAMKIKGMAGEQWIDGAITNQWGTNCVIIGGAYEEPMIGAYTGYWGKTDLSYPRVGEVYLGHIYISIPGNACADGITDAWTEIQLPQDTYFAGAPYGVQCFYTSPATQQNPNPQPQNVTNDPAANCVAPSAGSYGGWFLGWRNLARGSRFEVQFPIYSTKVKNGISDSTSKMTALIASSDVHGNTPQRPNNALGLPYQWVFVSANPPTIDYPSPSATSITNTTARTDANVRNHYTAGNIYFDLGTTTAYGFVAGPYSVANTYDAAGVFQNWINLIPGTTYHWRMRFVATGGGTYSGINQSFTTTGAAPTRKRGDFNNNLNNDLIWRNYSTGDVNVWFLNGTTYAGGNNMFNVADPNWRLEGSGDMDGNGSPDLIWRHYSTGAVNVWYLNGTTYMGGANMFTVTDLNWEIEGIADFDGDGDFDFIWRNYATGAVNVWYLNGITYVGGANLFNVVDPAWRLEGTGNFDTDTDPDLIWRNYSTGAVNVWYLQNGTYAGGANLFTVADLNWKIQAIEDYTGDGKPDLVWRNLATGDVNIWRMNGVQFQSGSNLFNVPGSAWNIAGPR